jgi:hypothetical protein
MIVWRALAGLSLAGLAAEAGAEPPAPGIYGNVILSEESGDLGGAELELIGTGQDARVEFVLCEGWCNEIFRVPVTFTPDGFDFSYVQTYVDRDGKLAKSETFHVEVDRKRAGVSVKITPAENPDWSFAYALEPIPKRFGLYVASNEDR